MSLFLLPFFPGAITFLGLSPCCHHCGKTTSKAVWFVDGPWLSSAFPGTLPECLFTPYIATHPWNLPVYPWQQLLSLSIDKLLPLVGDLAGIKDETMRFPVIIITAVSICASGLAKPQCSPLWDAPCGLIVVFLIICTTFSLKLFCSKVVSSKSWYFFLQDNSPRQTFVVRITPEAFVLPFI